ncbi:hypothetical protein AAZX31_04G070300 [Glycine max]|nr:hypothetical protein GLYMA_04G072101v4 [Glycine max]KAH1110229.1 hypothetical protein GYH30_009210 [Glycine max]
MFAKPYKVIILRLPKAKFKLWNSVFPLNLFLHISCLPSSFVLVFECDESSETQDIDNVSESAPAADSASTNK